MRSRMLLMLLLLVAVPVWAQSEPDYEGGDTAGTGSVMIAPPPVSGQVYPEEVGTEIRTNYVAGGLAASGGYVTNLFAGTGTGVTNETVFSIQPNIALDEVTPRQNFKLDYTPQFNFYAPTTSYDETDHNLNASYRMHLMPYVIFSVSDSFQKSATVYNSPLFTGGVSPSPPPQAPGVFPPLIHLTSNIIDGVLNWQYASAAMIGGSGLLDTLRLPKATQDKGLFDSDSRGASGFWTRQIAEQKYLGAVYQYFDTVVDPSKPQSETQTHSLYAFYTQYLTDQFSVSISAGPQHFRADQTSGQSIQSWSPAVMASLGWQRSHTSFAISYDRSVTAGGGLLGAYHSNSAIMSARWQVARNWTTSVSGNYSSNSSVFADTPANLAFFNSKGHTISGSFSFDHGITDHLFLEGEYDHFHYSYGTIPAVSAVPNGDRGMVSLAWRFTRPLGR